MSLKRTPPPPMRGVVAPHTPRHNTSSIHETSSFQSYPRRRNRPSGYACKLLDGKGYVSYLGFTHSAKHLPITSLRAHPKGRRSHRRPFPLRVACP